MTTTQAQESLVSTMKAYGIEAEDALDGIASKVNIIGNNFAANNSDLAEILQRSVSAMKNAGNTLDETLGLAVGGQEIVQNATKVGKYVPKHIVIYGDHNDSRSGLYRLKARSS